MSYIKDKFNCIILLRLIMDIRELINVIEGNPQIYEMLKYCPYSILKQWNMKNYAKGTIIFRQGEVYDRFCIAVSGYTDIYVMAESGKKYSQAIYTTGNFIGELEIFEKKPFSCFVEAISDVKLLEIEREYFLQWIDLDRGSFRSTPIPSTVRSWRWGRRTNHQGGQKDHVASSFAARKCSSPSSPSQRRWAARSIQRPVRADHGHEIAGPRFLSVRSGISKKGSLI
jgi:hypothetical protein